MVVCPRCGYSQATMLNCPKCGATAGLIKKLLQAKYRSPRPIERPLAGLVKAEKKIAREKTPSRFAFLPKLKNLFGQKIPSSASPLKMPAAAGQVAQGALVGAGLAAGAEAVNALKSYSFLLVILGLLHFFLIRNTAYHLPFSLLLLFLAALATFSFFRNSENFRLGSTSSGWLTVIAFLVWYLLLGKTLDNLSYLLVIFGLVALVYGLATRGKSLAGLALGLIPLFFFFLDMALLPWLFQYFNWTLTPLVESLVLFMPWWALLGFLYLPSQNLLVNVIKVTGLLYLIAILFIPLIPDFGHSPLGLPSPEELLEAEAAIKEKLPQKENPFWSNLICFKESLSQPTRSLSIQECTRQRQEQSEIESICKNIRKLKPETDYTSCLKEEQEKKRQPQIAGTEDPTIREPTRAEFKISDYFPKIVYQPRYSYPVQLEIKNPRQQALNIDFNCFFKKGREEILGTPEPRNFPLSQLLETKSIICTPDQDLTAGTYTLVFQANLYGLKTTSRLGRLFIGDPLLKTAEEIKELKNAYFPGQTHLSQAPKDFARINFGFGEPETNPLIEYDDHPLLISTIENTGGGRLLAVKRYYLDLEKEGLTPETDLSSCFSGTGEKIASPPSPVTFRETFYLTTCFVSLPAELANPEGFVYKEFEAVLEYDYQIQKEIRFEVKQTQLPPLIS